MYCILNRLLLLVCQRHMGSLLPDLWYRRRLTKSPLEEFADTLKKCTATNVYTDESAPEEIEALVVNTL